MGYRRRTLENLCYNFFMENKEYISIGKITNFFGIKGEAKVGYDNQNQLKNAKKIILADDVSKRELDIQQIRFHKNFAIIKFVQIDDINEIVKYKGQRIFVLKSEALKKLDKNEYLISDLVGCIVYKEDGEKIGEVVSISANSSQDLLNIKNYLGQISLVPFVDEFFPVVDVKSKKIIIKPIEGLLS